jgi:hypothetical protein
VSPQARTRWLLALGLLAATTGVGLVSAQRVREQLDVIEACEATGAGDFATALARTDGRTGASETGRAAAECRCLALLATQQAAHADCSPACSRTRSRRLGATADLAIH